MKFENKILLVNIDMKYLEFLHNVDSNIYYDDNNPNYYLKPHVGILLCAKNGFKYVIPLTSAKEKHKNWPDVSADYFRIYEVVDIRKDDINDQDIIVDIKNHELLNKIPNNEVKFFKQKILSVLDLRRMIPVVDGTYHCVDMKLGIDIMQNRRVALLIKELLFIKGISEEIENKATKIYSKQKDSGKVLKYYNNFSKLEEASKEYI